MSYVADKPIEKADEDLLGRSDFAKQFGKSIYEYDSKDGLVIGLYGKWGSGKTSIINMAISEIPVDKSEKKKWYSRVYKRIKKIFTSQRSAEEDQCHYPIIIRFSPWNYSDKNNLISLFFYELKNKLGVAKGEENKEKIGKAISQYSDIIDSLSSIPVAGPAIAPILKTAFKAAVSKLMKTPSLDEAKEKLCEALEDFNHKIIVFIDDIDRLTTPQIKDIFQLVKQVGDFPNIIYVLTMDREIVCNALSEYHNIDGDEYLKKIVQVSFEVPEIDKSLLPEILKIRLNKIVYKNDCKEEFENNRYFEKVLEYCVNPYIKNIRDINRLLNAFQFKYGALWKETSFVDLLAITAIEIFEPKLYKWIADNGSAVCTKYLRNKSYTESVKYREYYNEFTNLELNPSLSICIISLLFPYFAMKIGYDGEFGLLSNSELLKYKHIAAVEKFDLYFKFDINSIKISREKIYDCLHEYNKDSIIETIIKSEKEDVLDYLLRNMAVLADEEHSNRLKFVLYAIVDSYGELVNNQASVIHADFVFNEIVKFMFDIIEKIDSENERHEIIYSILKNSNKSNIGLIADILNQEEMAFGRFGNKTAHKDLQLVSLKHLESLEKNYIDKIELISKSENILNIGSFSRAFYLWEDLDKEGAENYVKKLFNDKVSKLKFICTKAYFFRGSNDYGWDFNLKSYSNYISREDLYNGIKDSVKNHLDEFTKEEQIILASFVLNYENNSDDFNHATEREALQRIKKWKSESKSN